MSLRYLWNLHLRTLHGTEENSDSDTEVRLVCPYSHREELNKDVSNERLQKVKTKAEFALLHTILHIAEQGTYKREARASPLQLMIAEC